VEPDLIDPDEDQAMRMHPPFVITCPRCFQALQPYDVLFRCLRHERPLEFDPQEVPGWLEGRRYATAPCPRDSAICSIRCCPECRGVLPHLAGHLAPHYCIALAGDRGSGKTLYWVRLVARLVDLAASAWPGVVPMFEDDAGQQRFGELRHEIESGRLPGSTPMGRDGNPDPIVVRLLGVRPRSRSRAGDEPQRASLTFYDPPGDSFQTFEQISYVRYLGTASSLILTIDSEQVRDPTGAGRGRPSPTQIVEVIIQRLRQEKFLDATGRIRKGLAVVLTKCDRHVFPHAPRLRPPEALASPWAEASRGAYQAHAHKACQGLLHAWGQDHFLNLVQQSFHPVRYFACSALGDEGRPGPPLGVIDPFLWTLGMV
jgi:hypothetical protein